jgi:hypothetical protein
MLRIKKGNRFNNIFTTAPVDANHRVSTNYPFKDYFF